MKGVDYLDFLMYCLIICVATLNLDGLKSFICIVFVMSRTINTARIGCFIFYSTYGFYLPFYSLISISSNIFVSYLTRFVIFLVDK